MGSKARQTLQTLVEDTFVKGSKERKAFTNLFDTDGIDINKDRPDASIVSDSSNWTKLGNKLKEQWNR